MAAITTDTGAHTFTLQTPYLLQGITTDPVAVTDELTVAIKVYAEGGENRLHAHVKEDHSFIVLEGEATFHLDTDDNIKVCHRYEGVMLPRGSFYRFENSGQGNLVMLHVGAPIGGGEGAVYPDGVEKDSSLEPYIGLERIVKPGPGFAAD